MAAFVDACLSACMGECLHGSPCLVVVGRQLLLAPHTVWLCRFIAKPHLRCCCPHRCCCCRLRVHGLIVGSPEKKRADPAVLRSLCSHTLPSGKNEVGGGGGGGGGGEGLGVDAGQSLIWQLAVPGLPLLLVEAGPRCPLTHAHPTFFALQSPHLPHSCPAPLSAGAGARV